MAGIPKKDERGRTVDVHALRHSFGTLLSKAGVTPRVAQEAMRHSTMALTMNVYTDPKLLDVAGAVEALPTLRSDGGHAAETARATGTDGNGALGLVLGLVLTEAKERGGESIVVKMASDEASESGPDGIAVSVEPANRKRPWSTGVKGCHQVETSGLEPPTPSLQS
ncbi:MAG: tyrosine-type recombinase/integrase [Planctomycetota bacterium]|nr:tyrosine-type recombinase/integrase [Planctomycetota bacterium]